MATVLAALISAVATILIAVGAGIFAVIQWKDQRTRELQEQRFEQYWKLIDTSQETPFLAKQTIASTSVKEISRLQERNSCLPYFRQQGSRMV